MSDQETRDLLDESQATIDRATRDVAHVERLMREWISISDYARKYGITRHTVYKFIGAGVVRFYKVGSLTRIYDAPPQQSSRCA